MQKQVSKMSKEDLMRKAELMKALASPVRLCILKCLAENPHCSVSFFTNCMDASQSTISQHLAKLRTGRIVNVEYEGTRAKYSLDNEKIRAILKIIFSDKEL